MILRDDAIADLDEIWSFGYERWGEAQADRYAARLIAHMRRLLDFPELGSPLFGRRPGVRSLKSGKHRVIYSIDDDIIDVARVLHSSRDFGRHLF